MPITPPVCKICGAAHWFSEPHANMSKPKAVAVAKAKAAMISPRKGGVNREPSQVSERPPGPKPIKPKKGKRK